jgi:ABC-type microcin C transport system permease subunit YejE
MFFNVQIWRNVLPNLNIVFMTNLTITLSTSLTTAEVLQLEKFTSPQTGPPWLLLQARVTVPVNEIVINGKLMQKLKLKHNCLVAQVATRE